jgi:peroxiredoxin Q/BCP
MTKFERAGVQPFGVNPATIDAHKKYVDKMHFNFPLLSDPDRAIARAYHALKEDDRSIARTVYVVGRDGTVRFAERGTPAVDDIVASIAGGA